MQTYVLVLCDIVAPTIACSFVAVFLGFVIYLLVILDKTISDNYYEIKISEILDTKFLMLFTCLYMASIF